MNWIRLALMFATAFVTSVLRVSWLIVTPHPPLRQAMVDVPLRLRGDGQIALLATLITLTPGTLSVDVSEDRRTLFVHVLDAPDHDAVIKEIVDGFEAGVMKAWP